MTDAPSRPHEKPAAPESADAETPLHPGAEAAAAGTAAVAAPVPVPVPAPVPVPVQQDADTRGRATTQGHAETPAPTPPPTPVRGRAPGWGPGGGPQQAGAGPTVMPVAPAPVPGWEWAGMAWVPKPGIIPLRPLSVGDMVRSTFALLRGYRRTVLTVTGLLGLLSGLVSVLTSPDTSKSFTALNDTLSNRNSDPNVALQQSLDAIADLPGSLGAPAAIDMFIGITVTALLTVVIGRGILGRPAPLSTLWSQVRGRLPQLLGLAAVVTLAVTAVLAVFCAPVLIAHAQGASSDVLSPLALLLLPGMLVALWLGISLSLAAPALILERQGIRAALSRSIRLVRGAWWRILGINLLFGVLAMIATGIIAIPFSVVELLANGGSTVGLDTTTSVPVLTVQALAGAVAATLTFPFTSGVCTLVYLDQRIRREALDLELAIAAGVPGYADQR